MLILSDNQWPCLATWLSGRQARGDTSPGASGAARTTSSPCRESSGSLRSFSSSSPSLWRGPEAKIYWYWQLREHFVWHFHLSGQQTQHWNNWRGLQRCGHQHVPHHHAAVVHYLHPDGPPTPGPPWLDDDHHWSDPDDNSWGPVSQLLRSQVQGRGPLVQKRQGECQSLMVWRLMPILSRLDWVSVWSPSLLASSWPSTSFSPSKLWRIYSADFSINWYLPFRINKYVTILLPN